MSSLKINRLWKPAADLYLRAKSSIKTISRSQSILTSTSKFLLDRDYVNRKRRIFGHFTDFFGNGPAYYRYYSTDDRDKRELNRLLSCLENKESYNNIYFLLRAPYFCSKHKCERRFLTVFDRWWSMLESLKKETGWKPTSIIFHLGALNKDNDGIIIKKLSKIDRLKSLEALVDEAAAVDFCSLPDCHDVLSFLTGIRDLAMDTKFSKVFHPSLIPSRTELFKNIDKYLREKEMIRKRQHDENPSVDSDWIFMITEEAPIIIMHMAFDFKIHPSKLNDFERDVLKRVCGLVKKGYDYYIESPAALTAIEEFGMHYTSFAHAWLLWDVVDPDDLVHGIWRSWFSVYPVYSQRIGLNDESNNLHRFTLCETLIGVCERFRKVDSFLPVFDIWSDDVRRSSPLAARCDSKHGGVAENFTGFVYSSGQCCKYFASINRRDLIDRMESEFLLVAMDALEALKGKTVTSIAIHRYLTGLRDFRSSASSKVLFPAKLNDKLLKYLNERMDHELSNSASKDVLLGTTARLLILLCRSEIKLDVDLWRKLLTPLRRENSLSLFEENEHKLRIIVTNFGEAMCHYSSIFDKNCQLQIPNDVMASYFELAKRFLSSVEPNQAAGENDKTRYAVTLDVVLNVANRFNAIKEFEKLKDIWQKRVIELVSYFNTKSAGMTVRRMDQLRRYQGVKFDSRLAEKLRLRGEEFVRKRKYSR